MLNTISILGIGLLAVLGATSVAGFLTNLVAPFRYTLHSVVVTPVSDGSEWVDVTLYVGPRRIRCSMRASDALDAARSLADVAGRTRPHLSPLDGGRQA